MNFIDTMHVVILLDKYVRHESTGNATRFARKLGICRATLFNIFNELKSEGIEIRYSKAKRSYYYQYPENVEIILVIKNIP